MALWEVCCQNAMRPWHKPICFFFIYFFARRVAGGADLRAMCQSQRVKSNPCQPRRAFVYCLLFAVCLFLLMLPFQIANYRWICKNTNRQQGSERGAPVASLSGSQSLVPVHRTFGMSCLSIFASWFFFSFSLSGQGSHGTQGCAARVRHPSPQSSVPYIDLCCAVC